MLVVFVIFFVADDDGPSPRTHGDDRVLIVGGGPTGLFMAHLLQQYQVPFVLLEAQTPDERFRHPQAHFLNTRTMEVLKHALPTLITNANTNTHSHTHSHTHSTDSTDTADDSVRTTTNHGASQSRWRNL
jgi:2-polyprenyl-6-methoxyphenol hydroxylase-like FAD-dependent oxidoreductase